MTRQVLPNAATGADKAVNAIELHRVTKLYGTFAAVNDVSLTVRAGEVHSLVGANGAGKSTLLGILSGRTRASAGDVLVFDQALTTGKPRASRSAGIAVVYQELTVLPALDACANVFLGNEKVASGFLSERSMRRSYRAMCDEFGIDIPADTPARELSVASEQLLEIMRAVALDARIVILDEPTAALSHREREFLLNLVERLRDSGVTVMLVTHNLEEVLAVSDIITVMRDGRVVDEGPVADWTKAKLVRAMTGDDPMEVPHRRDPREDGAVAFSARQVTVPGSIEDISLEVRAGEVLGLAGLVGAGRTTFLRAISGAEPHASGMIEIHGHSRPLPRSPREAIGLGIAMLPENRKTQGLVLGMSLPDNVTLPSLDKVSKAGMVSKARQLEVSKRYLTQFTLQRPVGNYPVGNLSGGNQQKVVLSKLLHQHPDVLIIDEPTRGIDVAAKVEVLQAIRRFAEEYQRPVIITSTEIDEVIEVSDRIVVLAGGRVVGELDNTHQRPSVHDVLQLAFGVEETHSHADND